jgi:hypothetical protein
MKSVTMHDKVLNEETAMKSFGALKRRRRDQHLTIRGR